MIKLPALLFAALPLVCMGSDKPDILLGQVTSMNSPLVGEISRELTSGYEAYFEQVNEQGGVHGRKIRLVQKDDGFKAEKTVGLTRELIAADKVVALVGYLGTPGPSQVVREKLLTDNDIAMIGPSTGAAKLLSEKNVFPVRATYEAELAEIVAHSRAMQHKKIALLVWNAGAGPMLYEAFPQIVADGGMELVHKNTFDPSNAGGGLERVLDAAIDPIAAARPDSVLIIAGGNALYEAMRRIRARLPPTLPMYTISSVNWQDIIKNLGVRQAQGVMISQAIPYPYSPRIPIVKSYMEQMKRLGRAVNYYSLEGYLGAAVTVEALRRAGPDLTRARFLAAMNDAGSVQLGGFDVSYSATRRRGFLKPDITLITSQGGLLR